MNKYIIVIMAFVGLIACSSSKRAVPKTVDEIYKEATDEFKDEDYLDAQKLFDVIKLQYPASEYADDAQYYLAEINFSRKEFQLAAFNYNLLRRIYQRSDYSKSCLFKTALCYYNLSPTYDRDQDYTFKAIQSFTEFQSVYPNDSLYVAATNYILELREKLAYKEYFIGQIYQKMDYFKSALVYYNYAIDDYADTKVIEPSYFGKIEVLISMKRYEEAKTIIDLYKKNFPVSENRLQVEAYEKLIK
jgi:outer membrane protein assembly factor BamD